ncbi:hypothetical protein MRX96_049321 [Rhipicephalus microplus]
MDVHKIANLADRIMAVNPPTVATVLAEASRLLPSCRFSQKLLAFPTPSQHCSQAKTKEYGGILRINSDSCGGTTICSATMR